MTQIVALTITILVSSTHFYLYGQGDLHVNNFNFFLNLFECVDFKNIFYKFIISLISAGKIVKNHCGFSLLKIQRLVGAVYA